MGRARGKGGLSFLMSLKGSHLMWIKRSHSCSRDTPAAHPQKKKTQGLNKNRNELSALTGKVLNGSGPSGSGNSSFEIESHGQASGLSVFATLTPQQRAAAPSLRQEMRGWVDIGCVPPSSEFRQTVLEAGCWLPRKQLECETPEKALSASGDAITVFCFVFCFSFWYYMMLGGKGGAFL